jgi:hypothetical protein
VLAGVLGKQEALAGGTSDGDRRTRLQVADVVAADPDEQAVVIGVIAGLLGAPLGDQALGGGG